MPARQALACFLLAAAVVLHAEAIACGNVVAAMSPCVNYLRFGGEVPESCCYGVRSLVSAARTTVDRQTACGCLKSAAAAVQGLDYELAEGLPGACGVNIPYKISPSTDCSKVQ